jgi:hypothetical protein
MASYTNPNLPVSVELVNAITNFVEKVKPAKKK